MRQYLELIENISLLSILNISSLPFPSIVILSSQLLQNQTVELVKELTNNHPITLVSNTLIQNNQYKILTSSIDNIKPTIHIFEGIGCDSIKDSDYKYKKKHLTKLSNNIQVIFIVMLHEQEQQKSHLGVHFIQELDPQKRRSLIIYRTQRKSILDSICNIYLNSIKLEVVNCYRLLLKQKHQLNSSLIEIDEISNILSKQQTNIFPYVYKQHQLFLNSIVAELEGNFISSRQLKMKTPLKCLMMNRLQQVWEDDYFQLLKRIQSINVKQIQQMLMYYNTELMHGFLSSNCFKNIFYNYMLQLQQSLISTLKEIVQILLITIEHMAHHYLKYLNIKQQFSQILLQKLNPITFSFIDEITIIIRSQIEYIYMSDEKYWKLNTINTSLYANSTFIQIKYIGISYIKKLADSLQEILPKIIGDRLIEKTQKILKIESLIILQQLIATHEIKIQINSAEREKVLQIKKKYEMVDNVMKYFTRHIDPISLIPDIKMKIESMFESYQEPQKIIQQDTFSEKQLSFFERVKRLFVKKSKHKKRSSSQQKSRKIESFKQRQQNKPTNQLWIKQSEWLLATNTNKKTLQRQRLIYSSKQGFPSFFRISIWIYLCTKDFKPPLITQMLHPNFLQNNLQNGVIQQIQKDIRRTPPPQLFAFQQNAKLIMKEVLIAYSVYDPQVSYTQGMNFIVSMIIRSVLNYQQKDYASLMKKHQNNNFLIIQQQTLTILSYILKKLHWREFFIEGTPKLFQLSLKIEDRIKKQSPIVAKKLAQLQLSSFLIFTQAVMTALTAKTSLKISQRIFDCFLIQGQKLIQNLIIRLLILNQDRILRIQSSDQLFMMLRQGIYKDGVSVTGIQQILRLS